MHTTRNFALCLLATFSLFLLGSVVILTTLLPILPTSLVPRTIDRGTLLVELSIELTLVISGIAMPLGFAFMYFFGGVVSPRAIKLYLYITRGRQILVPKHSTSQEGVGPRRASLRLRRQIVYFTFILAVVVSFATYLAKHREPIVVPIGRPSDFAALITGDFVSLTISASLIVPVVSLALPYFGELRLRSIDVGPFHTTVIRTTIGVSGGFSLLYGFLSRPMFQYVMFYLFLFMGVAWCFAIGCNLAADPANRYIFQDLNSAKPTSRLLSSRIWLGLAPGKLIEV